MSINPFADLPADAARQLHFELCVALDQLATIPHHESEVSLLMKCLESCYVEAIETPALA